MCSRFPPCWLTQTCSLFLKFCKNFWSDLDIWTHNCAIFVTFTETIARRRSIQGMYVKYPKHIPLYPRCNRECLSQIGLHSHQRACNNHIHVYCFVCHCSNCLSLCIALPSIYLRLQSPALLYYYYYVKYTKLNSNTIHVKFNLL